MTFLMLHGPIQWTFILHVLSGALALGALFFPIFSKKGSKLHTKAGWLFVASMVLVGMTSWVITPWRLFIDPARTTTSKSFALFLFFIAFMAVSDIWFGLRVLKFKNRTSPSRDIRHIGPPILLLLTAAGIVATGVSTGRTLLMIFPGIGIAVAVRQLTYWRNVPKTKMHWWYAHMEGMCAACIAAITAFLVTALPRLTGSPIFSSVFVWITPGFILGFILNRWILKYKIKFEAHIPQSLPQNSDLA